MTDLLEHIRANEDIVVAVWYQSLREMPDCAHKNLPESAVMPVIRRSSQALLNVMESGKTESMEAALRESAQERIRNGESFADAVAAWMLYRKVVQHVLRGTINDLEMWEQLVDRVGSVLEWVLEIIHQVYAEAGLTEV